MSGSLAPVGWGQSEQAMWAAYRRGEWYAGGPDIRAEAIRRLLLAPPPAEPGHLARLRLEGVRVTGRLDLAEAHVEGTLKFRDCRFERAPHLEGASLGALELRDCEVPGVSAAGVSIGWKWELTGCRLTGPLNLSGADIGGTLRLTDSELDGGVDLRDASVQGSVDLRASTLRVPRGTALRGNRLRVGGDLDCRGGLVAEGAVDLCDARLGGGALFEGATLSRADGPALRAHGIDVGAEFDCRGGFTAHGRISLSNITVRSRISFDDAVIDVPAGQPALTCRRTVAAELDLGTREPVHGTVDLSHTRVTVLRAAPGRGPRALRLEGAVYDTLLPQLPAAQRLPLLAGDPEGFTPQPYERLAAVYRQHGRDADARTVLLAKQRRLRGTLARPGRVWSALQDITVGYGYQPLRAVWWLVAMMLTGTLLFSTWPPRPVEAGKGPHFQAAIYTFDLLLPLVDFGQEQAYASRGPLQWAAVALVCLGWLLATTAAAGANRMLRRAD
ncbi:pentapeptide repeat-containing protein [Streptomyces sp. NPDC048664]|uniref:pentapeptide repeat-containing protein n=1 Tax=Streptomyces sp. NPDC048664 TaxID=3154505 RepID=UPI003447D43C